MNEQQSTENEELTVSFSRTKLLANRLNSLMPGTLSKVAAVPAVGFSALAAHELFTNDQLWDSAGEAMRFGGPASIALMGIASVVAARREYGRIEQDIAQPVETKHA